MIFNLLPISTRKVAVQCPAAVQLLSSCFHKTNIPQINHWWSLQTNNLELYGIPNTTYTQNPCSSCSSCSSCSKKCNVLIILTFSLYVRLQNQFYSRILWHFAHGQQSAICLQLDQADIAITLLESRTRQSDSLPPVKPKSTKSTWSKILFIKICTANCRNG